MAETDLDRKRRRLRKTLSEAAFRLEREVERQDACGYRDWDALVSVVLLEADPLDLLLS